MTSSSAVKPVYHSVIPLEIAGVDGALDEVGNLDFLRGIPILARTATPWTFAIETKFPELPHMLGGPIPLASEHLLAVLAEAGVDNIQTFAAVLRDRGGREYRGHSVLNVIGLIDAADLEASVGTILAEGENGPTRIEFASLVLSPVRARDLPMFRLFHNPATLLVNDRVLDALNRQRPVEGWGFCAFEIEMREPPD